MFYPEEGTHPCELVAHVQGELSLELWASLGLTLGVTRAQRDPWNTRQTLWGSPEPGGTHGSQGCLGPVTWGDLSTSTASPLSLGARG